MIEESKNGTATIRDAEYWKNLRIALAKNGVQSFADSLPKLKEVVQAAGSITKPPYSDKQAEFVINEVLIPTARVLLSLQIPEAKEDSILPTVASSLEAMMKCASLVFRQCSLPKASELILMIADYKKPLYKEDARKSESTTNAMSIEAPVNDKADTTNKPLETINEVIDQDESYKLQDVKLRSQSPEAVIVTVKRPGYRELISKLSQIFLEEMGSVWTTFQTRTPEFVDKYFQILGSICKFVHYQYLRDLFQVARTASLEYFQNAQQSIIRYVTKELFVSLIQNYEKIFDRLVIPKQKAYCCQNFIAEATLPLVRCRLIKSKLTGTKLLAHLASQVMANSTKAITQKDFAEWLIKNRIFQEVYNLDNHEQMIQQGSDIVKFLVKKEELNMEQLSTLLTIAQKGDANVRKHVMKILSDLTIRLNNDQFECINSRLEQMPGDIFYQDMIEIIYDMCKYCVSTLANKGMKILWNLISNHYLNYKIGVQERLLLRFTELLKSLFQKDSGIKPQMYIDQVIQLFQTSKQKKWVLDLLRKVIDAYPTGQSMQIEFSAFRTPSADPCRYLLEQKEFHKALLNELQKPQSKNVREDYLSFLSFLITNARLSAQHQLGVDLLLRLIMHPKTFSQCLHYFSDRAEQLLTLAASEPINSSQKMQCVWELFVTINKFNIVVNVSEKDKKYEINCMPQDLRGYHKLMEILVTTLNARVRDQVAAYLALLHCNLSRDLSESRQKTINSFVQNTLEKIKQAYKNKHQYQLLGYYSVIEEMMNETEKRGVGRLVAHSSLVNTESIRICITNEVTYGLGITKKIDFKFPSNKTLYEMLTYAGSQFKCSPDDIIINDGEREVKQRWNGLSLEDLGLQYSKLTALKCTREPAPKANLLDSSEQFTPRAKQVFTQIFHRFAPTGKMTATELVAFVEGSTHDSCAINDSRITETFQRYDDDQDGVLTIKNFLDFYQEASRSREATVWRNLDSLQYRTDLSKFEDAREVVDYHNMARYILYKSISSYDILFELSRCDKLELREKARRLLKRLPTSAKVSEQTLSQVGFSVKDEFSVWYKLTLILSILTRQEKIQTEEKQPQDKQIIELSPAIIAQWKDRFIKSQQYVRVLEEAERLATSTKLSEMSLMTRHSLSLCLQILRSLSQIPHLNKPLPETLNLTFINLSYNKLAETLIPQLYENMIIELFEPLMCFILNHKGIDIAFITPGLFNKDEDVRKICSNFLYLYQRLSNYSINILQIPIQPESREYYETVVKLIQEDKNLNLTEIFRQTYESVKVYPLQYSSSVNQTLLGKIKILDQILSISKAQTDDEFQDVLLQILHCSINPELRQTLYTMLLKTNPLGLTNYVSNFISVINPRQSTTPKQTPYVGIVNLGCICYMNAILQQFFMIPEMRNPILGMPFPGDLPIAESKKGLKYVNNLLYQLQKMFGYLSLSERSEYNPESFCYAYNKDIVLGVQEDAHEFLNGIFSKIEDLLKGNCFANLLNDVFGGSTIVTITCQTCNNYRHRVQEFKSILLGVRDNKNIDESFNQFIDKEVVSGLECESCGMKVSTSTKQTHLHTLPNTLIIQLGRIDLDMTTYESIKLHNKLEFPFSMNISKYVRVKDDQTMPEYSDCEYELKGIVIHSGTAAAGHYYSIIKVADNTWYKFDDSRVSVFNISELAEEAYGGREEYNDWGTQDRSARSKNAFVLLYEKKEKAPTFIRNLKRQEISTIQRIANITTTATADEPTYVARVNSFKGYIVEGLKAEVQKDNTQSFHELQFHHENFLRFVHELLKRIPIPQQVIDEANCPQLKAYYSKYQQFTPQQQLLYKCTHKMLMSMCDVLAKCANPSLDFIKDMGPYLYNLEMAAPLAAQEYFMTADLKKHLQVLATNNEYYVRQLYRMTANKCIYIMIFLHKISLQGSEHSPQKQKILEFLESALSILYVQIPKHWTKSFQYFDFWRWFCYSNQTSMQYNFDKNLICVFIDFLLEKKSPIKLGPQNYTLSNKYTLVQLMPLLQTLTYMINASHPIGDMIPNKNLHFLTPDQVTCLTCVTFYKTMIEQKQDSSNLNFLISTMARGNLQFSEEIAALLLYCINQTEVFESALLNMMLINGFMLVKDNLVQKRLQWIFGVPQRIQVANEFSIKNSLLNQTVSYVSSLYLSTPTCKSILELLFFQKKNPDNFSVSGVGTLLSLIVSSEQVLKYVLQLPPPSYMYASYIDWIDKFIDALRNEKYIVITGDREKVAADCVKSMEIIRAKLRELRKERGLDIDQPVGVLELKPPIETSSEMIPEQTEIDLNPLPVQMQSQEMIQQEKTIPLNPQSENVIAEQNKPVLVSLRPSVIVGRNCFIQQLPDINFPSEHSIRIQPTIHYTYVCESFPVGDNNLSLRKELFEYHTNYDKPPLKFFVYKENDRMVDQTSEHQDLPHIAPQSRPTVINLKVQTNTPIIVDLRHPELKAQIYLPQGGHYINVPFAEQEISSWLLVRECKAKELPGQVPTKKQQQPTVSSHPDFGHSGYMGPYPQDYYQQEVSCQHCSTLNHYTVNYCSVCGLNPT